MFHIREKRIRAIFQEEVSKGLECHLEKAIEKGVINALKAFGADVENQQEVQKDFHYLRLLRKRAEESRKNINKALVSIVIGGGAVVAWEGVKILLKAQVGG